MCLKLWMFLSILFCLVYLAFEQMLAKSALDFHNVHFSLGIFVFDWPSALLRQGLINLFNWRSPCHLVLSTLWALATVFTSLLHCFFSVVTSFLYRLGSWQFSWRVDRGGLPLPSPGFACHARSFASPVERVLMVRTTRRFARRSLIQWPRLGPSLRPRGLRSGHLPVLPRRVATEPLQTNWIYVLKIVWLVLLWITEDVVYNE